MANGELIKYIKEGISNDVSLNELKKRLLKIGWSLADVEEALTFVSTAGYEPSSESFVKPVVKSSIESRGELAANPEVKSSAVSKVKLSPSAVLNVKKTLLIVGALVLVVIMVLAVLVLVMKDRADVISKADLEDGVTIEMEKSMIKLNYDEGKSKDVELLNVNSSVANMNIGGREVVLDFEVASSFDFDFDGVMDIEIIYQEFSDGMPKFFIRILEG